jgi:hypothetical protein
MRARASVLICLCVAPAVACLAPADDKPPAADEPAKDKAESFTLRNKAKDICVVSDRDESVRDYFRRNRILVCTAWGPFLKEMLETKKPLPESFVIHNSQNDDPERVVMFGAHPAVGPPSEPAAKLVGDYVSNFKVKDPRVGLILCRDAKEPGLYRVVGYMERGTWGFFAVKEVNDADGFSPKDLLFQGDPKK